MDDLVPKLLTFPPVPSPAESLSDSQYDQSIRAISQLLTSAPPGKLGSGLSTGEDVFDILDPSTQSLAYLHILCAHIEAARSASKASPGSLPPAVLFGGRLWPRIVAFVEGFDPIQVRYAGSQFRFVLGVVTRGSRQTGQPMQAVSLLRSAILRLDPTSSTLTSTHHKFVRLCLTCKAFQQALPVLERTIYHLPVSMDKGAAARATRYLCSETESSAIYLNPDHGLTMKLSSRDCLEYHLYGGMIYMGLKQWERAMSFLEVVLLAPCTNVTSAIMVEAYKKWVLVGLLLSGRAPSLPKGMNKNMMRNIHALAKPYDCLVEAFTSGRLFRLKGDIEEGQSFWLNDCNFGLVLQVYDAFRKFSVLRLANIYAALPLTEVARRTSPDPSDLVEAASYITRLIVSGELNATLTVPQDTTTPATLRFLSSSSVPRTEADVHYDLTTHKAELETILKHLQGSDHRLEISKEYIDKLRVMKKQKEQETKAGVSGGQVTSEFDEDVMADL
ncbi:hypothetical protein GJ744_008797 [Endocarpon pusillum]|uniref:COP9 signalosome complex subunit 3 N-terminal helical repeats domain-containing protein n=1 Tax=Endocarpon pusillum TaxID=364733 RepID=A0A8H7AQJ2_9EURO|nr:hypothetical protein GJ744_008797 [Endocarpon pusillum]